MTSTVADQVRLYVVRGTAGEISEGIRNLISAGVLAPGDALPPIRALADDLEVHRNTVAGAYRLLVAAGVVETQGRRGSFVRAIPFLEGEGGIALPGSVDLASGNPDPALLPDLRASLDRTTYTPRLYGAAATEPLLDSWARSSIEDEVLRPCSITITNGAVDAVERLLTAHLTRGDAVAIEDPCFWRASERSKPTASERYRWTSTLRVLPRKGCCVLSKVVCARLFAPLVRTTPPGSA